MEWPAPFPGVGYDAGVLRKETSGPMAIVILGVHVFCSFLALMLHKELFDRCTEAGIKPEWRQLLRDLDRLQSGKIEKDGRSIAIRTPVSGQVGPVFRAVGVALPPNIAETEAA